MNSLLTGIDFDRFTDLTLSGSIAIVGVSGRYPGGANSPKELWEKLKNGVDCVGEAKGDRWDLGWHNPDSHRPGRVYTRAGGYLDRIDEFDADFFGMSPREARQVDPQQRLLLELAWEAFEDAAITPRDKAGSDTGVFIGISGSDYAALGREDTVDAYTNTGSAFSIAANRISYILDLKGPSFAVDTACSSSLVCVHQACTSLLAGECSMALAGGVNLLMHIRPWVGFSKASMLSPDGRCKSFDASGNGYVRAEGGGLVLLKPLAAAERDGDRILGVILASGINSDGRTLGLSLPNGEAQEALLRKVYARSGVSPKDVFYVEAHGTGTAVGDPIECGALGRVLGESRADDDKCLIGSVKSNIGHLEPASGIAGLTKLLLALKHGEIPANLHFETPNPKIEFDEWKLSVVDKATPLPQREQPLVFGVNSFGFGGANAHVVLQQYRPRKVSASAPEKHGPHALLLSAQSDAAVRDLARAYVELLRGEGADWTAICAAAATGRSRLKSRLAVLAESAEEAAQKLDRHLAGETVAGLAVGQCAAPVAKVAFVYSGNGPQWWGMGRGLLANNPVFAAEIDAVDAIFAPLAGWSICEEMARPESESRIERTEIAQPMLFAMQLGLTRVLREAGVAPAATFGHSVGEVAAACASGALTREQATQVIYHRSREQAKTAGLGRMAALGVDADQAQAVIDKVGGWLELAAVNSAQAVTVAGDPERLQRLVDEMTAAGKFARMLQLDYPFHTRAMDPLREGLVASLSALAPRAADIPFVSTVTGSALDGCDLVADYWHRNVREPVRFHDAVAHLVTERDITVFVEIGPHPVLKDYVLQSAKSLDVAVASLQTLRRPGKTAENDADNLANAICACYANGGADFAAMFDRPATTTDLPLYPWQRTRHWRGAVGLPGAHAPVTREHPLLGHRVPAVDGLWENTVDTTLLPWLNDHVILGSVLFPAAGYVEMALAAGQRILGATTVDLESVEIQRPLTLAPHVDPLAQISVDASDGVFRISSKADPEASDWTQHVRGRISGKEGQPDAPAGDLAALSAALPRLVGAEEFYSETTRRGMEYGPAFRGIRTLRLSRREASERAALAEIELGQIDARELSALRSHPTLLDSCLQAFVGLIALNERRDCATIPVHIDRLRSLAPLPSRIFCHVVMRKESPRSAIADFAIYDAEGQLLMTLEGARCQKVDFHKNSTGITSEWWRPDMQAPAFAPLSPLPAPGDVAVAAAPALERLAVTHDRAGWNHDMRPRLHALIGAYAISAVAALQAGDGTFDVPKLARKGGIKRDRADLLKTLLRFAEEDGYIVKVGSGWRRAEGVDALDPQALWRTLMLDAPAAQAELLTLAQLGDSLPQILRGDDAGDISTLLDQMRDMSPFQAYYNETAQTVLRELLARWPADRPIRVLEIGGAGGGLAAWLLPQLPAARADYLFTDPVEMAMGRAAHRFGGYPFARFAVLDPMLDFEEQGICAGGFDLVVGADLTRLTEDATTLLARLRKALAADGALLLLESDADRFGEFVFARRPSGLRGALGAAGFDAVAAFDDAATCRDRDRPQMSVLLAHASTAKDKARAVLPASEERRRWLLLLEPDAESASLGEALAATLAASGDTAERLTLGAAREAAILSALQCIGPDELVYVADAEHDEGALLATQSRRCMTAADILRAIAETSGADLRLTFVTRGAFATAQGQGPRDPGQAPLWGMGRVIANENPNLGMRLVDLHDASAEALAAELMRRDEETEIQLFAGLRYLARHRFAPATAETRAAGDAPAFTLAFEHQGGLDSLHLREMQRRAPASHEVEIAVRGAGLNFRDVLWTMGMLPEEAVENGFSGPTIGMECSGEVTRVGDAVTALKPGDRVIAFASSCFASHVTTNAGSAAQIPDHMSFEEAATIPTAFLTAYYALEHLARLEPGETVLIHGAAGGVGLAALQIAKLKGAIVIGTSGSARKRRMLEALGADYAVNSRALEFADEVKKITNGVGVDVVLNSLAGEAITKSLDCLRPFGRFLEIGKRDLYANSRIGLRPFRNNLSYFGIDADTLLIERADLARRLMREVMALFETRALRPLPFQKTFVSRAQEAFRAMQQSRHVGKLVVSVGAESPETLPIRRERAFVRPEATYLVTGGLGGFGLATAEWLVEQGATSLALLGRRGATTPEAQDAVARMETAGASVRAFPVDVSDRAALDVVLSVLRAEMAPLAGVFHSAAAIEDAPVLRVGPEQLETVFGAKMLGAFNLHEATLADRLEQFVLYSSSSAAIGNPGQSAYVAANLYLDALAQHRRVQGLPGLAVEWGAIADAGFLTRNAAVADMLKTRSGLEAIPAKQALACLSRLDAIGAARACVADFDLLRLSQLLASARSPRFAPIVPKSAMASLGSEETLADLIARAPAAERRGIVIAQLLQHGARVLGSAAEQIDIDQPLADIGFDSLMAVELAAGLERDLGRQVSVMQVLGAGSLSAIADLVLRLSGIEAGDDSVPAPNAPASKRPARENETA